MENLDLEDKINLIYDYLYNTNTKNIHSFYNIEMGKIGLIDVKIPIPEENNDDIKEYNKMKENIFNGRFKLISFNEETTTILFKKYSNQFPVSVKISFYKDNNINSFDSNINNDSLFSYLLSQLVLENKTKHILMPIINIDMKLSDIEKLIKDDDCYDIIKKAELNNRISNMCCMQFREHFFKVITLEEYLQQNKCDIKPLLFQVVHTLATLQMKFNGFRHNDLTLKNIMVYQKKNNNNYVEYNGFKKDMFYLTNSNFDIKIANFEHSIIPKFHGLINSKDTNIKFADQINPYYDIYIFLNDLLEKVNLEKHECNNDTKKFLDKIIPPHIRGLKNFNKNIIIVNPIDLLNDKYFDDYRNKPSKNYTDVSLTNHIYLTGSKFQTYIESDNYSILGNQDKIISKSSIMSNIRNIKSEVEDTETKLNRKEMIEKTKNKDSENIRKIKVNQMGGDEKPHYINEKNTPFVSNEERKIRKDTYDDNPKREQPVLLEQKIYDNSRPPPKPKDPPPFIPLYDMQNELAKHLLPYSQVANQPTVNKVYNISLANPIGNFSSINRIYEDVLPGNPFTYSARTVFERKQLTDFLRNNILEDVDGEEMKVTGGKNSLLSYIKIMDVNPYVSKVNPYQDLPRNFLLYRSAYPVRFNEKTREIGIAKEAMGINIRMYMMSIGDTRANKTPGLSPDDFDLWREIKYYNWVREQLIKKKISPNFISPILYKIDSESRISWDKLEIIKSKGINNDTIVQLKDNQKKINELHRIEKGTGLFRSLLPLQFRMQGNRLPKQKISTMPQTSNLDKIDPELRQEIHDEVRRELNLKDKNENNNENKRILKGSIQDIIKYELDKNDLKNVVKESILEDFTANSGKVLVLLTEAPNNSIIQWATPLYESFGSQKKMISTGYHTQDVWKSILFQMVYVFAVLQKAGIYMDNLSLKNNFYIKDIFSDPNSVGSWIYKIDNVEYYIPNYGYILTFDSKYADISTDNKIIKDPLANEKKYKIYWKDYTKNSNFDMDNIKSKIFDQFKSIMDPDNFGHAFKVEGGAIPDENILQLLRSIKNSKNTNIEDCIPECFKEFLNNRVGTLLTVSEKENINMLTKPNFNAMKGSLMVYQERFDKYVWAVYIGDDSSNPNKKRIVIKDNNGKYIIPLPVFGNSLYSYPADLKVLPESSKNMKYDESYIYETYNFNDL